MGLVINEKKISVLLLVAMLIVSACNAKSELKGKEYIYKIVGEEKLKAYIFSPEHKEAGRPAIVLFHGGGWAIGKPSWMFGKARDYASKGLVAVSVQYRLSDQSKITPIDAMDDACDVVLWLKKNSNKLGIDPDKIITYGWSAGGHLAASTAIFPKLDPDSGLTSVPSAMVLYASALSVVEDSWFDQLLLGKGKPIGFSPAEHINKDTPPAMIVAGENDTTTPLQQSELFHATMQSYGNESYLVVYKGVGHLLSASEEALSPDKEMHTQAHAEIDSFLGKLKYIKE